MVSRIYDASIASFNDDVLFPFIAHLKSRKAVSLFKPVTWAKSEMCLNNLTTTQGTLVEPIRSFISAKSLFR